jgi:hypothetical protein
MKALATMSDLASVINGSTPESNTDSDNVLDQEEDAFADDDGIMDACQGHAISDILSLRLTQKTILAKDEFIFGVFEDGFCPGQVIEDYGDKVDAIFMLQTIRNNHPDKSLWKWPSLTDRQILKKVCVLKIRPNLDVAL